jgi:hypothetical protein
MAWIESTLWLVLQAFGSGEREMADEDDGTVPMEVSDAEVREGKPGYRHSISPECAPPIHLIFDLLPPFRQDFVLTNTTLSILRRMTGFWIM